MSDDSPVAADSTSHSAEHEDRNESNTLYPDSTARKVSGSDKSSSDRTEHLRELIDSIPREVFEQAIPQRSRLPHAPPRRLPVVDGIGASTPLVRNDKRPHRDDSSKTESSK